MFRLLLLSALAVGPVFDPVIVRPSTVQADGGTGNVVRTNSISVNSPLVLATDGGSVLIGLNAPYCVGVDRGLGFDSGFFCQVWDAGSPLISAVSGTLPIVVTSDGGRGVDISFNAAYFDAGTVKVVTGTSPIVVNPDGGGGYDVTFPSWASTAAVDKYLSMTGVDTGNCQTTACRTWAYINTTIPYRIPYNLTLHVDAGTYSESLNFKSHVLESAVGQAASITIEGPPQTATTVTTGTNTGHATAVSNGAGTDYSYITDSNQTWTTDDLQGAWADFAGVKYLIARNTATRLTIPNTLSPVPAVDAGYTIMRPAATFTGGSSSTALDVQYGAMGSGSVLGVTDVAFTATGIGIRQLSRTRLTLTRVSSIASGAYLANISSGNGVFGGVTLSNSFLKGAGGSTVEDVNASAGTVIKLTSGDFMLYPRQSSGWGAAYVEPTGGNGAFRLGGPGLFTATSLFLHCTAGSQYGLYLQAPFSDNTLITGSVQAGQPTTNAFITNLLIDNCLRPVVAAGATQLVVQTTSNLTGQLTAADQSVAITVNDGASVKMLPAPVLSDAGVQLSMDSDTYTLYNVSNTSTKALRNLLTNSYYKQNTASAGGFSATGGTITDVGGYRIHTFTTSGTFTVTGTGTVDVLVVAGGGGAGYSRGGGGGAGGVIVSPGFSVSSGAISVTVGAGGADNSSGGNGNNGSNSVFSTLTAIGGGGGAGASGTSEVAGNSGGSGGGTTGFTAGSPPAVTVVAGGAGTSGQGTAGGRAFSDNSTYIGAGGGGGAGAVGGNGHDSGDPYGFNPNAGHGGIGISNSYSGSVVYYGGGGGGGPAGAVGAGVGGQGGGGNGSAFSPTAGAANTGGGGGGGSFGQPGKGGGSGIVIVRYVYP